MTTFPKPEHLNDAELDRLGDFFKSCSDCGALNCLQPAATMPRQIGPKSLEDLFTSMPHPSHAEGVAPACNRLWAQG
jgi:hypothetical protein